MTRFFALLTIVAIAIVLGSIVLAWTSGRRPDSSGFAHDIRVVLREYGLWFAAAIAITCTLGSLYLSEVANFIPCKLCWYQRFAMYPLAVILPIAAYMKKPKVIRIAAPVALVGGSISIYHYLIERFPDWASGASCDPEAPCTLVWIWQFHFISIPFMALSGFAAIITLLLWAQPVKEDTREQRISSGSSSKAIQASVE